MTALARLGGEVVGLFIDDGALALAIVAIVALSAVIAVAAPGPSLLAGATLLFGCLGALVANVLTSARRDRGR